MTQWLWSYVSFERGARLITGLHTALDPDRLRSRDGDAPAGRTEIGLKDL